MTWRRSSGVIYTRANIDSVCVRGRLHESKRGDANSAIHLHACKTFGRRLAKCFARVQMCRRKEVDGFCVDAKANLHEVVVCCVSLSSLRRRFVGIYAVENIVGGRGVNVLASKSFTFGGGETSREGSA